MLKKLLTICLSLLLVVGLTACDKEQTDTTTDTDATENTEVQTDTTDKEPTDAVDTDPAEDTTTNADSDTTSEAVVDETAVSATVITDARCKDELCANLETILTSFQTDLPNLTLTRLDFSSEEGKAFYNENELTLLPAILFDEKIKETVIYNEGKGGDERTKMSNYIDVVKEQHYSLRLGSQFDPMKEVCDNGVDDNENDAIDCEDTSCQLDLACNKVDKPVVELFVMSHCPFGTQAEKAFLPVAQALGDNIDFQVKFVDYAMHGEEEVLEQLKQYCVQKEEPAKFLTYLECFLGDETKGESCLAGAEIDTAKLEACQLVTDETFKIKELLADQASWQGGKFPQFNTDKEAVTKYEVKGSPSVAINGTKVEQFNRSEKGALDLVCGTFNEKPEICNSDQFSDKAATPGFGWEEGTTNAASAASCGN